MKLCLTSSYTLYQYSESLMMRPVLLYIPYSKSSHKKNGNIITFPQLEDGNLVEYKRNVEKYESVLDSTDKSSTDNDCNGGSISANVFKDIWKRNQVHTDIKAIYARLKICDRINQAQSEWKGADLSQNNMGNG